jgi:hypothetical protein
VFQCPDPATDHRLPDAEHPCSLPKLRASAANSACVIDIKLTACAPTFRLGIHLSFLSADHLDGEGRTS